MFSTFTLTNQFVSLLINDINYIFAMLGTTFRTFYLFITYFEKVEDYIFKLII